MKKIIENKNTNERTYAEYATCSLNGGKPTRSKFVNDTFGKNPATIMSQEEINSFNVQQKEKATVKCSRVTKYLGSEGFKSSLGSEEATTFQDKITNTNIFNVKNCLKDSEPKKYLKKFEHIYENKRVYYP